MEDFSIEEAGMRLANRAYAYRLFHIAFGAEPSCAELAVLGSKESVDALSLLAEASGADGLRLCAGPDGGEEVAASDVLSQTAELLAAIGGRADDAAYAESLKSAYTRLFLVPGDSYVHPWESPYIGKEAMLFQESTLDVRHRYRDLGFAAVEFGRFPEDHVAMMLDFLAHVSSRVFDAFGDERDDEAARMLAAQRDFVATHLLNWLPAFCEKLHAKDAEGVYCRLADALRAFLATDELFAGRLASRLEAKA